MCNADTGVLGQVWFNKDEPQAFPDFKTKHKCKNFDAIREWGEIHQVSLLTTHHSLGRPWPYARRNLKLTISKAPANEGLPPDYIMRPALEDVLVETP